MARTRLVSRASARLAAAVVVGAVVAVPISLFGDYPVLGALLGVILAATINLVAGLVLS